MRTACLVLALAMLPTSALGQSPEIEVVDGKISMSVTAMPLGRLLSLIDRAMGTTSEVKPDLANRNISAQFTGLEFNDAVRKIFQGQPLNYMIVSGKGIRVTEVAQAGAATTASSAPPQSPSFQEPQIFPNSNPIPPTLSLQAPQPIINPAQGNAQQAGFSMTPFGPQPIPNANNQNGNPNAGPLSGPGALPPALGMNNPFNPTINNSQNGGNVNGVNGGVNNTPFPSAPAAPPAPGSLGGATPGTLGR